MFTAACLLWQFIREPMCEHPTHHDYQLSKYENYINIVV